MSDQIDSTCLLAFVRGDKDEGARLLKQVVQPKLLKDSNSGGLVYWAAKRGWLDVIKVLLEEYYCDPMDGDDNGCTPLHAACYKGHIDVVRYYIEECKCDPMCKRKDDGRTLLHVACVGGHLNVIKYLMIQCNCDPMCRDNNGYSPLYTASSYGQLQVIKYLIINCNCDPNDNTNNRLGSTPLHIACYKGHIDVVRYYIEECNCDPMCKGKDEGYAPLHVGCAGGCLNVIEYLILQCNCDPLCRANNGDNPLHTASEYGQLEVIKYLINDCNCDPTDNNDRLGSTPLHAACYMGHIDVVRYYIEECKCDPMSRNRLLSTPLHQAVSGNHYGVVHYLLCIGKVDTFSRNILLMSPKFFSLDEPTDCLINKFSQIKSCTPIDSYMNIFLLGNSGVGKTTLTQVIKKRANGVILGKMRSVSNVELLTAGIIPYTIKHDELGNIVIHDLAGQPEYYSSHSAVMEDILNGSSAVFIIVVKLSDDPPYKWLNLVKNLSSKCSGICHVLTVASHKDAVKHVDRMHCRQLLKNKVENFFNNDKNICNSRVVSLDCRKLDGNQFTIFIDSLSDACQSIRNSTNAINSLDSKDLVYCRMLYKLLLSKNENVYLFDSLFQMIKECSDLYLPETKEKLQETLDWLHRTGLIMFINSPSGSWVVIRKQTLLTLVNGKIFSPFQQHNNLISNTGELNFLYCKQAFVRFIMSLLYIMCMIPLCLCMTVVIIFL